jgi:leucyl aminopeptidase
MRVRIAPKRPAGPVVEPVLAGQARPGFGAGPDEVAWVGERWLVTLGEDAEAAGALVTACLLGERRVTLDLRGLAPATATAFITGACLRAWRFDRLKSKDAESPFPLGDDPPLPKLHRFDVLTDSPGPLRRAWHRAESVLVGVALARDLVAEPSNTLTPAGFEARIAALAQAGIAIDVLKGGALRRAGLGGLLAVGQGSAHRPRLIVLRWPGVIEADPVVFVGKGITFDTGGICIKPAAGMEEMRADMAGAAACVGAMLALATRRSPAPAAAVLALAENATGGASYRPSDVLQMGDGTTVEVVDTDAEGRLVLADAIGWAVRHLHPAAIVDLATLTGSIVTALGHEMAGLFDNDPALAAQVAAAGGAVGEPVWRMPIGASHREDLRSDIADIRHCVPGRGQPDACHAAAFLEGFAQGVPWVHLDIAGMESRPDASDRHAAGATGFGVRLLDRLMAQSFEDPHR